MNRYSLWKYLIIAAALLFGLFYTLPNLFGEAPAVQISAKRSATKIDTAVMKQIEDALRQANLGYVGEFI